MCQVLLKLSIRPSLQTVTVVLQSLKVIVWSRMESNKSTTSYSNSFVFLRERCNKLYTVSIGCRFVTRISYSVTFTMLSFSPLVSHSPRFSRSESPQLLFFHIISFWELVIDLSHCRVFAVHFHTSAYLICKFYVLRVAIDWFVTS